MDRQAKARSIKIIDALISTCTEKELEKFRLKGALKLDLRQQLILVLGNRRPKCSPRRAKKKFEAFKAELNTGEGKDWTRLSNLLLIEYFRVITYLSKRDSICKSVDRAAEIISGLLAREKQINPFLRNIDPGHFALCLKATYLNHYPAYLNKEALEVVSACIFHDLSREVDHIELTNKFRTVFARLVLNRFFKFWRFLDKLPGMHGVTALSIFFAVIYFSSR